MVPTDNSLAAYPPELITRVAEQAARDADLTAHFLKAVGLAPPPGTVRRLPSEFLLELGAAMRLLAWEVDGLDLHEPGLPTARDAILQVVPGRHSPHPRPLVPGPVPRPGRLPHHRRAPGLGRAEGPPRRDPARHPRRGRPGRGHGPVPLGPIAQPLRPMTGARRHERATRRSAAACSTPATPRGTRTSPRRNTWPGRGRGEAARGRLRWRPGGRHRDDRAGPLAAGRPVPRLRHLGQPLEPPRPGRIPPTGPWRTRGSRTCSCRGGTGSPARTTRSMPCRSSSSSGRPA